MARITFTPPGMGTSWLLGTYWLFNFHSSWFYMVKFAEWCWIWGPYLSIYVLLPESEGKECASNLRGELSCGSFASLKNWVALRQKLGHGGTGKQFPQQNSMTTYDNWPFPSQHPWNQDLPWPILLVSGRGPFWALLWPTSSQPPTFDCWLPLGTSFNKPKNAGTCRLSQWWKKIYYLHQQATGTFPRHTADNRWHI